MNKTKGGKKTTCVICHQDRSEWWFPSLFYCYLGQFIRHKACIKDR